VLLIISRSSAFIQIEGASLFLIIPGVLLLIFGRPITRASLLPWLYLSFMLPWFDLFLRSFQPYFQRITAILGSKLLSLIYPVFRNDTYIQLPSINLEVARECSGVAFFISVLAIGIPLVYLTQRSWGRAVLVLVLGIMITILANAFRVASAGVLGENFGPALLHGPAHILQGWLVAWIGWIGLFIVNMLVVKKTKTTSPRLSERWKLYQKPEQHHLPVTGIPSKQIYLASAVIALCAIATYFASPRPVTLSSPLLNLPITLSTWRGVTAEWLEKKSLFPGADEQMSRIYNSTRGTESIYLHISYFNKQTERKRLISSFSRTLHNKTSEIKLSDQVTGGIPSKINRTTLYQDGLLYDVFFWYQFPEGISTTSRNQARMIALKNGITHRQNNGAVILIAVRKSPQIETANQSSLPEPVSRFLNDAGSEITDLLSLQVKPGLISICQSEFY
jgi:EpsI family protein